MPRAKGPGGYLSCFLNTTTNHNFKGDTAEWIVERTNTFGPLILPNYGTVAMTNAGAFPADLSFRHGFNSDPYLRITMLNQTNTPNYALSTATEVSGTNNINFTWDAFQ